MAEVCDTSPTGITPEDLKKLVEAKQKKKSYQSMSQRFTHRGKKNGFSGYQLRVFPCYLIAN